MATHTRWRILCLTSFSTSFSAINIDLQSVAGGGDLATGGTASASTTNGTNTASNAFDGSTTTFWQSTVSNPSDWIAYQFAAGVELGAFEWRARTGGSQIQMVQTGEVQYSDDGVTWFTAWAFSNSTTPASGEIRSFVDPAVISSLSPSYGAVAGGTAVTITGVGFTGATGVTFDGIAATSVVVVNDTTITCVTPAHAYGSVTVGVQRGAKNLSKTTAFLFADSQSVRLTQLPLIGIEVNSEPARVTQLPLLLLSTPVEGERITQLPLLVAASIKPVPFPEVLVPEVPVTETWEWQTVITIMDKGREQRSRLRESPRVGMSFGVLIDDDSYRRAVLDLQLRFINRTYNYPMFHYSTRLSADAASADVKLYFDPASTDMRPGEPLALLNPQTMEIIYKTVFTVDVDGATLTEAVGADVASYWLVCPAPTFRSKPTVGLAMNNIAGDAPFNLDGVNVRSVLRPGQGSSLTTYDGFTVLDKVPLADADVDENYSQNVIWLDNFISAPEPRFSWNIPFMNGERVFKLARPQGMDYWRSFAAAVRGRQVPFLLPTFRDDLPLTVQPALSASTLRSSAVQFFNYWRSGAYRYVRISSDAGVIYRRINEVVANYDVNGDAETVDIKLNEDIGSSPGANENLIVSFANTCRLDSDTITLRHEYVDTFLTVKIRTVEDLLETIPDVDMDSRITEDGNLRITESDLTRILEQ